MTSRAAVSLPTERHSHGPRRLAATEACRGSYDTAVDAIARATGTRLGKRQTEQLARRAAVDFDTFYATRQPVGCAARADADDDGRAAGPTATGKWLTASVTDAVATVIGRVFDEADRRDPTHRRDWVALVDGNNHQIARITAEAAARSVHVTVIIDFVCTPSSTCLRHEALCCIPTAFCKVGSQAQESGCTCGVASDVAQCFGDVGRAGGAQRADLIGAPEVVVGR